MMLPDWFSRRWKAPNLVGAGKPRTYRRRPTGRQR